MTRVNEVQVQVDEVQNVMRDNVSQMLSNYEKAEVLEDKAATLTQESKKFYKRSNQVKKNMCMKNFKMNLIIALVVIVVLLIIIVPIVVTSLQAREAARAIDDNQGSGGENSTSTR